MSNTYVNYHNYILTLIKEAVKHKRSLISTDKYESHKNKKEKWKYTEKGFVKPKKNEKSKDIVNITYR